MNQDRSTQILFGVVFIAIPSLYFVWRLMPYLLFYALPFILLSCLFTFLWIAGVMAVNEDFSWLGIIIPLTAIAVFLIAGFPKDAVILKNGSTLIDGQFFYNAFNAVKAWFDHALWSMTPEFFAPSMPVPKELYDLNDVRWILWTSLGIGAPAIFIFFASHRIGKIEDAIEAKYKEAASHNYNELCAMRTQKYEADRSADIRIKNTERERDHFQEELSKLKTIIEFQKKAAGSAIRETDPSPKKGVLDSEDL